MTGRRMQIHGVVAQEASLYQKVEDVKDVTGAIGCELSIKNLSNRPRHAMECFASGSPRPASQAFPLFVFGRDFTEITLNFFDISKIAHWDAQRIIHLITGTTEDAGAEEISNLVTTNMKVIAAEREGGMKQLEELSGKECLIESIRFHESKVNATGSSNSPEELSMSMAPAFPVSDSRSLESYSDICGSHQELGGAGVSAMRGARLVNVMSSRMMNVMYLVGHWNSIISLREDNHLRRTMLIMHANNPNFLLQAGNAPFHLEDDAAIRPIETLTRQFAEVARDYHSAHEIEELEMDMAWDMRELDVRPSALLAWTTDKYYWDLQRYSHINKILIERSWMPAREIVKLKFLRLLAKVRLDRSSQYGFDKVFNERIGDLKAVRKRTLKGFLDLRACW